MNFPTVASQNSFLIDAVTSVRLVKSQKFNMISMDYLCYKDEKIKVLLVRNINLPWMGVLPPIYLCLAAFVGKSSNLLTPSMCEIFGINHPRHLENHRH